MLVCSGAIKVEFILWSIFVENLGAFWSLEGSACEIYVK